MKAGRAGTVVKQSKECFNMLQLSLFKVAWMMELSKFADGSNAEALNCAAHTRTFNTHKYTIFARGQSSF